jgi:hypothetical protein
MVSVSGILLALATLSFYSGAWAADRLPVEFERLEGPDKIIFKSDSGNTPKEFKPGWVDLAYLGTLDPGNGATPYFLFSGKPCEKCPNDKALLLLRPPVGSNVAQLTSFVYPGKLFESRSKALALESRAFFGRCLPGRHDVYVVFQKERVDRRRRLQESVMVAEAEAQHLNEQLIERHLPRLDTTLRLVRKKACHEVEGRNRVSSPIPLGNASTKLPIGDAEEDDSPDVEGDAPGPAAAPAPNSSPSATH